MEAVIDFDKYPPQQPISFGSFTPMREEFAFSTQFEREQIQASVVYVFQFINRRIRNAVGQQCETIREWRSFSDKRHSIKRRSISHVVDNRPGYDNSTH